MSKIFISHSSANNAAALAVAAWLEENGWGEYFLDVNPHQGLAPGVRWQEALRAAADRCEAVLFLISPAWRDSRWCLAEFLLAKQLGKKVFGVLIERVPLDTLPKELTAEWQLCDLAAGTERRAFTVSADPVVPETVVSFGAGGLESLKLGLKKAGLDPLTFAWPPATDPARAPYRGLKPLEHDDAAVFFGREVAITRAVDALRHVVERGVESLFVILGASGAGKSSFLRAGLWPRLKRDDRQFLPLAVIRPQGAVVNGPAGVAASIEAAFRDCRIGRSRADIRQTMRSPGGLAQLVSELQAAAQARLGTDSPPPTVLMAIDQAEELFVSDGHDENEEFLAMLGAALATAPVGAPASSARALVVVAAIRSDSYNRLQSEPRLAAATQVPFNLGPIARDEFKSIIVGPAGRATASGRPLNVDPVLTERLLRDAEGGADALPLLAFTLERLYVDYGGDGELSAADYDALGGVRGSIEAAVDAAFANPAREPVVPPDKAARERLLRQAFIPWLAWIDPDTDERRRRVADWEEIPAAARPVLERLVDARLLVRDSRVAPDSAKTAVVVEVAHEALLRQWPTLTAWLDQDADALKSIEAARRAASEWVKNRREPAWLAHTGERLQAVGALRGRADLDNLLGAEAHEYLSACSARDERVRADREAQQARIAAEQARTATAQRRSTCLLAAGAIGLVVFAGWTVAQSRNVSRQRSRVLIVAAEEALNKHVADRSLRLGVLAAADTWLSPAVPEAQAQLVRAAFISSEMARVTHDARVHTAVLSSDGGRIVTASEDKTARVVDVRTAKEIVRIAHDDDVSSAAFSADGGRIVTTSKNIARIFDAQTGREIARVTHTGVVSGAVFSPDGRQLLTSSWDQTARLVDAQNGSEVWKISGEGYVWFATFSPDARRIVIGSAAGTLQVFDVQRREEVTRLDTGDAADAAAFSPDGLRFVVAGGKAAVVFDTQSWKEVGRHATDDERMSAAAFSPDGQRIVTVSGKRARVADALAGTLVAEVRHDGNVTHASFSPDGRRIVTASMDGTARVSDAQIGKEIARVTHEGPVFSAAFDGSGQRVVTASADKTARLSDVRGRELTRMANSASVSMVAFDPGQRHIVTVSTDGQARIFDAQTGEEAAHLAHGGGVASAAFSPDGRRIVTASGDKSARVFDVQTKAEICRISHDGPVVSASFSRDGRLILTASKDQTARISDAQTGKELAHLSHGAGLASAAFSPDGRRVGTTSDEQRIRLWEWQTGKETVMRARGPIRSSMFSPDGARMAVVADKTVLVFDAATGRELARVDHEYQAQLVAFSPDGRRILSFASSTALISDSQTGRQLLRLAHDGGVRSAVFSPDGRRIVTGTDSGRDLPPMIWVYDAQTGKEIARMPAGSGIISAAFSGDGRRLATGSFDNAARVWNTVEVGLSGRELIEMVCRDKLLGANRLTAGDVDAAPVLLGDQGEDVCGRPGATRWLRSWLSGARP